MPYVVKEGCTKCNSCIEMCPVKCFCKGESMLVINPEECIDCGVCALECPVEAISSDKEPDIEKWVEFNAEYAKIWPRIVQEE